MKKELLVEYLPMRSEEMITDFYYGDYHTLVLESGNTVFYKENGYFCAWFSEIRDTKIKSTYKVYYLISKDEFQYTTYSSLCNNVYTNLKKNYPEIFDYDKIIFIEKNRDNANRFVERMPHETDYTFTDLKNESNIRCLNRVVARHIYLNKNLIHQYNKIDIPFKAPFKLIAKK